MERIRESEPQMYFSRLTDEYLNHQNDCDAKCKKFREIMADFFREYVEPESKPDTTWADCQKKWYKRTQNFSLNKYVTELRMDLNLIVHEKKHTDENLLYYFYRVCVAIIINISGVVPDKRTKTACGELDESYLEDLNEQQRDIVIDEARIVYVNAGPGTGKTHLLVYKIVDILVREKRNARIIALSYTRTSAASLSRKLSGTMEKKRMLQESVPFSGTIHSFCLNCLRAYNEQIGNKYDYVIADNSEIEEIIDDIYCSFDGKYEKEAILGCYKTPSGIYEEELVAAVKERKDVYKRISVGEILGTFLSTLQQDEQFLQWCSNRMNWLLVDEAQDLTVENYRIFDTLLEKIPSLRLFLVGDPRQNIFGFLGGSFQHLDEFLQKYNGQISKKFLSHSYRCPKKILDFTNEMVFSDCDNIYLDSLSDNPGIVSVEVYDDDDEEADMLVQRIKEKNDYINTAILAPRLKLLTKIVDRLNDNGISFIVRGGGKSIKPHIQAFVCMNRIAATNGKALGPCNGLCEKLEMPKSKTTMQFFSTDVGKDIKAIILSYKNGNISYLDFARHLVKLCRKYLPDIKREEQDTDFKGLYNKVIKKADSPESFSNLFKAFKEEFESLEVDFKSTGESKAAVTLSTIHSAKGLEWNTVYLPGMCDKYFPNPKLLDSVNQADRDEEMNTAKKLMFVAVSRVKKELIISYSTLLSDSKCSTGPSRLLGSLALL